MTKRELEDLEGFLVGVEETDDKIEALEHLYFWVLKLYRKQGKEKLGKSFRDDL